MKIIVLTLFLAVSLSSGGCREAAHPLPPAPPTSDQLRVNPDGTANATGIVLENNYGCAHDAECYLKVRAGDKEIRVIYNPGESEDRVNNDSASDAASKVKKDAHVEVYGKYRKQGTLDVMEIYSSENFYIHILKD